jgi:predicted phage terminase large subunit-like protein
VPRSSSLPESLVWARRQLPAYFAQPSCRFHAELMRTLEAPTKRLVARVAPRGHAKSTCAAFAYPLWCICEQRKRNILVITCESSLATQFVRDMRHELETNPRIRADYGDLCEPERVRDSSTGKQSRSKWTEYKFTTVTGITVHARGTGGSLRGVRVGPDRPDLIICDDIEKDEHVESPEGRRKLEQWLRKVVMPALGPDGQLLVLGSIIHFDSLLANLRDRSRFPRWDYAVYRALECRPVKKTGQYRRVALWSSRWPVKRLDEERARVGSLAFEQEYQANPIDETIRVFPDEWLKRYDESELVEKRLVTLMAVDPAAGRSAGDYFAMWVGSIDTETGVIYTRELRVARVNVVEQVKRIVAAFERWKPLRIGIETVAYQKALKDFLDDVSLREGLYMPVVEIKSTANKRARIEGSAAFYENGTFRLPRKLDADVEEQFLHFPKARHDDAPDVCAMGIELARGFRSAGRVEMACEPGRRHERVEVW